MALSDCLFALHVFFRLFLCLLHFFFTLLLSSALQVWATSLLWSSLVVLALFTFFKVNIGGEGVVPLLLLLRCEDYDIDNKTATSVTFSSSLLEYVGR